MKYTLLLVAVLLTSQYTRAQDVNGIDPNISLPDQKNDKAVNDKKDKPFVYVEQMPTTSYNMDKYLAENLHYPDAARRNNVHGRIIVQFTVNEDGTISDCKVLRGIGSGCDEEALRVIKNMPPWKPGRQEGKAVKVLFTKPISFTLNNGK
jgi:protein TonB